MTVPPQQRRTVNDAPVLRDQQLLERSRQLVRFRRKLLQRDDPASVRVISLPQLLEVSRIPRAPVNLYAPSNLEREKQFNL